jgi:hypothetical protein
MLCHRVTAKIAGNIGSTGSVILHTCYAIRVVLGKDAVHVGVYFCNIGLTMLLGQANVCV